VSATSGSAAGERAMVKVKRLRTADCVVGGFRYESDIECRRLPILMVCPLPG
jgi:hypothetical protein